MRQTYFRLLKTLRPYWRRTILGLVAIFLYATLSGLSVTLVVPFLDNLFDPNAPLERPTRTALEQVEGTGGVEGMLERSGGPVGGLIAWKDATIARARGFLDAGDPPDRLRRILVVIFLVFLFKNLFGYAEVYLVHSLEQRCLVDIRQACFAKIQALPLGALARMETGALVSRVVNDVNVLRGAIIGSAAVVLRNGLMILAFLAIILLTNWRLALATLIIVPPNVWLLRRLGKLLRRDSTRIQVRMGEMAGRIQETATGARVVKAFGREDDESERFRKVSWDYYRSALRLRALGALNAPLSEMLGTISVAVIVGYGGLQVIKGKMAASHLVLFVTAVLSIAGPLKKIAEQNQVVQEGVAAGTRIYELQDAEDETPRLRAGASPPPLATAIRYEGVGFAYEPGQPVLEDVNLDLRKGEVLALVGPSGAGKSTIADLLPRFYEPSAGRLTLDGTDAREFSLKGWRAKLGIVTQDVVLFNASIRENLAYGRPNATQGDIESAAEAARALGFIEHAPRGFDTVIGERGLQLSGGERQRLAIARAILRDPEILVFDEATSALDSESERLVQEAIERLMRGRTALVIAHRLSTIQGADQIAVIEGGRVVELGRHAELLGRGGVYTRLHELQFAAGP